MLKLAALVALLTDISPADVDPLVVVSIISDYLATEVTHFKLVYNKENRRNADLAKLQTKTTFERLIMQRHAKGYGWLTMTPT